jgi:predicted membrane protein (TIGR00267 family)
MFEEDGLPAQEAGDVARVIARHPDVLLRTMVEKELSLHVDEHGGTPLQGALVMGAAFGLGAVVPILPYLLIPIPQAIWVSLAITGAVLFGVGVAKARLTRRSPLRSGLEILAIGAAAGIVGYVFGNVLPPLLGAPPAGA